LLFEITVTVVFVTSVTGVVVTVHRMHVVTRVHVVRMTSVEIVWPTGCAAVVTFLHLTN
jgi:hypothetical protein